MFHCRISIVFLPLSFLFVILLLSYLFFLSQMYLRIQRNLVLGEPSSTSSASSAALTPIPSLDELIQREEDAHTRTGGIGIRSSAAAQREISARWKRIVHALHLATDIVVEKEILHYSLSLYAVVHLLRLCSPLLAREVAKEMRGV